jgi:FkbM family methyltransferase
VASNLKAGIKNLLAGAAAALPWGVRQRIFEELLERHVIPHDTRYDALVRLAAACNVEDFTVNGEVGRIRGSARDASILKQYALNRVWAGRTIGFCKRFFADGGGTYIDVGANIGLTTIPIGKLPGVRCIGIEAEPGNFRYLQENVSQAGVMDRVVLRNLAVFSRQTTIDLEIATSNLGDHRIRLGEGTVALQGEDRRSTVTVDARPLDDIIADIDPDLSCLNSRLAVKIDVQGAEPFVFEGGQKILGVAGLLIVEYSPYCMARMQADPAKILGLLQTHFTSVQIGQQEEDAPTPRRPVAEACAYLRRFAEGNAKNPNAYLDIIAER